MTAAAGYAHADMQAKYDARNPAALKRLVQAGAQLRPFTPEVMDACQKAAFELYAEISKENADFKKIWTPPGLPERRVPVVAGGRVHLRQLHGPLARQGLSGPRSSTEDGR